MESRTVGRSGLRVSRLGLGTAAWGTTTGADDARGILRAFTDAGGSLIDTSPAYGAGRAERALGEILREVPREHLVLSSDAGVDPTAPVGRRVDCSRRRLLAQLDATLARLGTDHLDIWSVGYWDRMTPVEETAETLDEAVASGRVRYVGVRGHTGWQLACTAGAVGSAPGVIAAQANYSLLERGVEEQLLPAAGYLGAGVIAAAPLAHGVLAGAPSARLRADAHLLLGERSSTVLGALRTAAEGLGTTPAAAAVAWAADRPGVVAAVVEPATARQATDFFARRLPRLPEAITAALEDVSG